MAAAARSTSVRNSAFNVILDEAREAAQNQLREAMEGEGAMEEQLRRDVEENRRRNPELEQRREAMQNPVTSIPPQQVTSAGIGTATYVGLNSAPELRWINTNSLPGVGQVEDDKVIKLKFEISDEIRNAKNEWKKANKTTSYSDEFDHSWDHGIALPKEVKLLGGKLTYFPRGFDGHRYAFLDISIPGFSDRYRIEANLVDWKVDWEEMDEKFFLKRVNENINKGFLSHKAALEDYEGNYKYQQAQLEQAKNALDQESKYEYEEVKTDTKSLRAYLKKITDIPEVNRAYFASDGSLRVFTKRLVGSNKRLDKKKRYSLGRFMFTFLGDRVKVYNLTYRAGGYQHPNVEEGGSVCFGDNEGQIKSALRRSEYFDVTLFLIDFLTVYPQDEDTSPWVDYEDWYEERIPQRAGFMKNARGPYVE